MANRRCNFRNGKVLRSFSIWQGVNGSNAACSLTLWQNMLMAWKCMQNKIAYIVKNETQNQVWYPCRSPILSTFCGNAIFFYVRSRLSNLFYCHVRERDCGRLRAENIASHCPKLRLFNGNALFVVVKGHSRYVIVRDGEVPSQKELSSYFEELFSSKVHPQKKLNSSNEVLFPNPASRT